MYGGSVHDVYSSPNAPQAVERGGSVQLGLVLSLVGPGHMLLPLRPPAVPGEGDHSAGPTALGGGEAVLLVVLLSVGDAADGAVGGAFVGVLIRKLLLLPVPLVLGQGATEASSQHPRRRHGDWEEGLFLGGRPADGDPLLVRLTQRL